jgi:uncharacterized hydrophobic protein (TIGR00271 family)
VQNQKRLTRAELGRVADRVGASPTDEPGPLIDTTDLIEMLEAAPPARDDDHWVYAPVERVRILQSLFLVDGTPWMSRFGFLLAMSVVIATLGLANDQPAAVIAAMVVAPMMNPVLGVAASLTLGLARQAVRLGLVVVVASVLAVALAWAISASLVVHELTGEELSRTTPRLRDLVIALAAGGAGMYSVVRKDLSGVVPGVAIAVALVPPLATIGIVLELQQWSLARGAALLYGVNVLAIVFAAVVVLLVTDFMESPRVRDPGVLAVGAVLTVTAVAIVVPVWLNSRRIDREVTFSQQVDRAVAVWLDTNRSHRLVGQRTEPGRASLVIAGATIPADLDELRASMATEAFPEPALEVDWVESSIIQVEVDQ